MKPDGSITVWGHNDYGGDPAEAPTGEVYTKIFSTSSAFAALTSDGSITAWGSSEHGGSGAPEGDGYTKIFSTNQAFAALKADGRITVWGHNDYGGDPAEAPTGSGYTQIFATSSAFAALTSDGSITAWGSSSRGGSGVPAGSGYSQIFSTDRAFAALKSDPAAINGATSSIYTLVQKDVGFVISVTASYTDGRDTAESVTSSATSAVTNVNDAPVLTISGTPTEDETLTAVLSDEDGKPAADLISYQWQRDYGSSITAWGSSKHGGNGAPIGSGYTKIFSNNQAFAALKLDGSITVWGGKESAFEPGDHWTVEPPYDNGYTQIFSNMHAFAALKADGRITTWGGWTTYVAGWPCRCREILAAGQVWSDAASVPLSKRFRKGSGALEYR